MEVSLGVNSWPGPGFSRPFLRRPQNDFLVPYDAPSRPPWPFLSCTSSLQLWWTKVSGGSSCRERPSRRKVSRAQGLEMMKPMISLKGGQGWVCGKMLRRQTLGGECAWHSETQGNPQHCLRGRARITLSVASSPLAIKWRGAGLDGRKRRPSGPFSFSVWSRS